MSRTCPDHPAYRTGHPPTSDCVSCWAAYGRRRAIDDGLRSQGKLKRSTGRASKAKGREAVLLLRTLLLAASGLDPDDFLVKATSMAGVDLHLSPAATRWFPYAVEVKNVESLNIWAALKQAAENADGKIPILVFKRAGTGLHVALRLEDFLALHPCPSPSPAVASPPAVSTETAPQP